MRHVPNPRLEIDQRKAGHLCEFGREVDAVVGQVGDPAVSQVEETSMIRSVGEHVH